MSKFSQRHYEEVAKLFSRIHLYDEESRDFIINEFADLFEKDNPRFKRLRFIQKCQEEDKS